MARSNNKMFLSSALLLLSIVLIITGAQSRMTTLSVGGDLMPTSTLTCNGVIGVKSGDDCTALAKANGLSKEAFSAINPNLNCDALFVGQWLCVVA